MKHSPWYQVKLSVLCSPRMASKPRFLSDASRLRNFTDPLELIQEASAMPQIATFRVLFIYSKTADTALQDMEREAPQVCLDHRGTG